MLDCCMAAPFIGWSALSLAQRAVQTLNRPLRLSYFLCVQCAHKN